MKKATTNIHFQRFFFETMNVRNNVTSNSGRPIQYRGEMWLNAKSEGD
jgi:hypothetical protein